MFKLPKPRRSPALVVAILALVAALAGSAFAVGGLTSTQKKQVKKIAVKVFNSRIGGATVARAGTAETATKAKSAETATKAKTAETATKAKSADTATHATNADQLGGRPASDYQIRLQGSCPHGAIEAIGAGGEVACTTPVEAIVATPAAAESAFETIGSGLQLAMPCHDGFTAVIFQNLGSTGATLNWFYSDGSATNATGVGLGMGGEKVFDFAGKRLEGQFIFSVGSTVITVNLHAYDGGTFCEVRGTAETASM